MKPAAFEYCRPGSVDEAVGLLRELGDDAKVIAGGQSLVPMMNLRLAVPGALVDIGGLADLEGIATSTGTVEIGSRVRHLDLERAELPGPLGRLLRTTARHIGHLPIRTLGTFGGSVAHADPSAEWCVVARTLDAEIVLHGPRGERTVGADNFFRGYFTTAVEPDELVTAIRLPDLDGTQAVGFAEFARRAGDFAIVAAVTVLDMRHGRIAAARIGLAGVADRPIRADRAEAALVGEEPSPQSFADAANVAAAEVDPPSDVQASADDRRDLVRALVRRALAQTTR